MDTQSTSTFKVGDRVEVVEDTLDGLNSSFIGMTGTISKVSSYDSFPYEIDFDKESMKDTFSDEEIKLLKTLEQEILDDYTID